MNEISHASAEPLALLNAYFLRVRVVSVEPDMALDSHKNRNFRHVEGNTDSYFYFIKW